MKVKDVIVSSLIIASVGCSNPPKIWEERDISKQVKTKSHKYAMEAIKTPEQARKYLLEYLHYTSDSANCGRGDCMDSFKKIHRRGHDDCEGGTVAAAALLKDNGYPSLFIRMCKIHPRKGRPAFCHSVFPYQENKTSGLWGSLGISKADCKKPQFETIEDLVRDLGYIYYDVLNLDELYDNWINKSLGWANEIYGRNLKQINSHKINK